MKKKAGMRDIQRKIEKSKGEGEINDGKVRLRALQHRS